MPIKRWRQQTNHDSKTPRGPASRGSIRDTWVSNAGIQRLRDASITRLRENSRLLWNTASLVATMLLTSGLGFLYWSLAARRFAPADVGLAAAVVSAMSLLAFLAMFGLGTMLVGELPKRLADRRSLLATALLVVAVLGGAGGVVFTSVAPVLWAGFRPLGPTLGTMFLFAAGVGFSASGMVVDQALVGLLRGDLQLVRNVAASIAKLAALAAVAVTFTAPDGLDIFSTWVFGTSVSLALLAVIAMFRGHSPRSYAPRLTAMRGLIWDALSHHALNVSLQVPTLVLPVVVTVMLSTTVNAYFFIAFMVAGLVFAGPSNLALTLYAVGSRDLTQLGSTLRFTMLISLLAGIALTAAIFLVGSRLLYVFGAEYERESFTPLVILTVGVFPMIVRSHFVALARIRGRTAMAVRIVAPAAVLQLTLAVGGAAIAALPGVCLGWVAGATIEAAIMIPLVTRSMVIVSHEAISRFD